MERTILHCDFNGFFASVECVRRPELRTVPMAVCGDPENRHGIILAKNELAKRFGVATAEYVNQPTNHRLSIEFYQRFRLCNALLGKSRTFAGCNNCVVHIYRKLNV